MRVCAIIVTRNRRHLLRECLESVLNQSRVPDCIVVVDNASIDGTREMIKSEFSSVTLVALPKNEGGAGGFNEGLRWAYNQGFDWFWLMDDDAKPAINALDVLLSVGTKESLDVIGPLVVDRENPGKLAFALGARMFTEYSEAIKCPIIYGVCSFFNGVLLKRDVVTVVGFPRKELYIRGDEIDYYMRILKSGFRIATITSVTLAHPSGLRNRMELGWRYLTVQHTGDRIKDFYMYRNRGFLARHYFGLMYLLKDIVAYTLYYVILRRCDLAGWWFWLTATVLGFRGKLIPFEIYQKARSKEPLGD